MKRAISLVLSMLLAGTALAGCQTKQETKPGTDAESKVATSEKATTEKTELKGEIVFWHSFAQGPRLEKIQAASDGFMKENPGVKIKIETYSWSDFYTKWTTGLSSGNVPDLSSALSSQVVEMIDADALLPLDDLIDKIGRDKFYEKTLTELQADGKTFGVPLYSNTEAMWYRKDLLKKYNLEVPETWDELYQAAKVIGEGEKGKTYGQAFPTGTNDMMATRWLHLYMRSAGETLITKEGKANLTSKVAIDGINYWVKVYKEQSPQESINYNVLDQATLYYQGKTAFDFNTGFHIGGVKTNTPDLLPEIDCAPIPRVNKADKPIGCETNTIPLVLWKNSKHPEIAKAFMEYFYQPERYVDFLLSVPVGMMSAIKGVTEQAKYKENEIVKNFAHADSVLQQMQSGSTSIGMEYGPRAEAGLLTSQRVIENMFQDIILNGTQVEKAAKAAEDKLNELFASVAK